MLEISSCTFYLHCSLEGIPNSYTIRTTLMRSKMIKQRLFESQIQIPELLNLKNESICIIWDRLLQQNCLLRRNASFSWGSNSRTSRPGSVDLQICVSQFSISSFIIMTSYQPSLDMSVNLHILTLKYQSLASIQNFSLFQYKKATHWYKAFNLYLWH